MMCDCCKKDENGNWLSEPCCGYSGVCESDATNTEANTGMCIHCGAEMFKEDGIWWHWTQEEIPLGERGTRHYGI